MSYDYILGIDPSGNFDEGKGTTGWCLYNAKDNKISEVGFISALPYKTTEEYWHEHIHLIRLLHSAHPNLIVVIEDYVLYASKAESQTNSRFETPKVIGIMQQYCWLKYIPYTLQLASLVKNRWTNEILLHKGIIEKRGSKMFIPNGMVPINRHTLDSIRHATHYATFKNKEV
jgi:hypothetical protein